MHYILGETKYIIIWKTVLITTTLVEVFASVEVELDSTSCVSIIEVLATTYRSRTWFCFICLSCWSIIWLFATSETACFYWTCKNLCCSPISFFIRSKLCYNKSKNLKLQCYSIVSDHQALTVYWSSYSFRVCIFVRGGFSSWPNDVINYY